MLGCISAWFTRIGQGHRLCQQPRKVHAAKTSLVLSSTTICQEWITFYLITYECFRNQQNIYSASKLCLRGAENYKRSTYFWDAGLVDVTVNTKLTVKCGDNEDTYIWMRSGSTVVFRVTDWDLFVCCTKKEDASSDELSQQLVLTPSCTRLFQGLTCLVWHGHGTPCRLFKHLQRRVTILTDIDAREAFCLGLPGIG